MCGGGNFILWHLGPVPSLCNPPTIGGVVCVHSLRQDCSCSPGLELLCSDEIVMIMFDCFKLCVACLLCLLARACDMFTALL